MKKIVLSFFLTLALLPAAYAQSQAETDDEDLMPIGRPEHYYQYALQDGIRRLPARVGSHEDAPLQGVGSPLVPVVLVQFADRPFHAAGSSPAQLQETYDLYFNSLDQETVSRVTRSYGSVRQYFRDQSLGQFTPRFEILGPVTLEKGYASYGANSGNSKDTGMNRFYSDALSQAIRQYDVDWSRFDSDSDGLVDMVFFIYAGWGENTVGKYDPDAIWAKEASWPVTISADNGQSVTFACSSACAEARFKSSSKLKEDAASDTFGPTGYNPDNLILDGIGVCVHELSHALGLPDFYDVNYQGFAMDYWSLMDYGEYVNKGYNPSNYTAYERDFVGWQPLVLLTDTTILTLSCFADGGVGYKILNDANEDEYYVIENRQAKGWDIKLGTLGAGLQVTHVDYNAGAWTSNRVNAVKNHQRMTIIAANNNYTGANVATSNTEWLECLKGNLFPHVYPTQSLTPTSAPPSVAYAGDTLNKPLYDITLNEDSTVTVYFLKSKADYEREYEMALDEISASDLLDVYDLRGIHLLRCLRQDIHRYGLKRGIYVLRNEAGVSRKAFLRE